MAEVSRDDRAQMIIIGGLIIALGLVAVATILNGLIFSQNLASRGNQLNDDMVVEIKEVTTNESAEAIRYTNKHDPDKTPGDAEDMYDAYFVNYSIAVQNLTATRQVHTSFDRSPNGVWEVAQNQSLDFTDASGSADWGLTTAQDADTVYRMNFTDVSHPGSSNFTVTVDPLTGNDWEMNLTSSEVVVTDGTTTNEFSVSYPITVEVMNGSGSINGSSFDLLSDHIRNQEDYQISFEGGDQVQGKYFVRFDPNTVSIAGSGPCSTGASSTCASSSGRIAGVVHNASIDVNYFDAKVNYTESFDVTEGGDVR